MIIKIFNVCFLLAALAVFFSGSPARAEMIDFPVVKLQSLDKVTARTMTFEARVGSTIKFGPLYIKIQACREAPPIEKPESASFLQIWEVTPQNEAQWIFSGWMFASSPALSSMNHPIYDVWVIDCLGEVKEPVRETTIRENGDGPSEDKSAPQETQETQKETQGSGNPQARE